MPMVFRWACLRTPSVWLRFAHSFHRLSPCSSPFVDTTPTPPLSFVVAWLARPHPRTRSTSLRDLAWARKFFLVAGFLFHFCAPHRTRQRCTNIYGIAPYDAWDCSTRGRLSMDMGALAFSGTPHCGRGWDKTWEHLILGLRVLTTRPKKTASHFKFTTRHTYGRIKGDVQPLAPLNLRLESCVCTDTMCLAPQSRATG